MRRCLFLALVGIALGTACTPEEQCQRIAVGSPSAGLGTFTPCSFATLNGDHQVGCFDGGWDPNGFDAGPGAMCLDAILNATDFVGSEAEECTVGPDTDNGSCVIWASGGKVVGHEWADFF